MSERNQTKFSPNELAEISAAVYGYAEATLVALETQGETGTAFRERIMNLRGKIQMLLEDNRYHHEVLFDEKIDQLLGKVYQWQANHVWLTDTTIQIRKVEGGWEAEVWSQKDQPEKA